MSSLPSTETSAREDVGPTAGIVGRSARLRWVAVLVAVAVLGALGWSLFGPARGEVRGNDNAVVFPGGEDFSISLPSTLADKPYSFGAIALCVHGIKSAVVDSVKPGSGSGLAVTAFAVRRQMGTFGADQVSLQQAGFGSGRTITGECAAGEGSEIGVEITKAEDATARLDGLLVSWHSGDRHGTAKVPLHLVLCQGPDQDVPSCQAMP